MMLPLMIADRLSMQAIGAPAQTIDGVEACRIYIRTDPERHAFGIFRGCAGFLFALIWRRKSGIWPYWRLCKAVHTVLY